MYPQNLKYTKEHEWIRDDGGVYTCGITDYAAEQLGDVTYVDLPTVGKDVKQGGEAAAVESVKAASDVYAPVDGTVAEVNVALNNQPELVNQSPYENGWFFKLKDVKPASLANLMDADAYASFVKEHQH